MFTGIIEEVGTVDRIAIGAESAVLTISADKVLEGTKLGDSIAVNGVCLTVTSLRGDRFQADVMAETLRRSSLGVLGRGSRVNLERAMAAGGRFGGHIVAGHIDGTGTILSTRKEGNAVWVEVGASAKILRYIIEKGSIAIDGISLTVALLRRRHFFTRKREMWSIWKMIWSVSMWNVLSRFRSRRKQRRTDRESRLRC